MARPERVAIQNGVASWDAVANDNFINLFDVPRPIPLHSGDESDLESTYPAASYDKCWIYVDHTVDGWTIYESDGSSWAAKEFGGGGGGGGVGMLAPIAVAITDEVTTLTTGAAKVTFRMPAEFTLVSVFASLTTASSSGDVVVDVEKNGASIFTTDLITIEATEESSLDATTQPNITTTSFDQDDEITVDIDSAGAGAKGLKLYLIGTYTASFPDYSASEVAQGYNWIDGKPVYRASIAISTYPNNSTVNNAHGISDIDKFVKWEGAFQSGTGTWHPLPHAEGTSSNSIAVTCNTTNVTLQSQYNWAGASCVNGYVHIYYTKTTD